MNICYWCGNKTRDAKRITLSGPAKRRVYECRGKCLTITEVWLEKPKKVASKTYRVRIWHPGAGCGYVVYENPRKTKRDSNPMGGLPLHEVLPEAGKHGALVKVTVELLEPGQRNAPKNPWNDQHRKRVAKSLAKKLQRFK